MNESRDRREQALSHLVIRFIGAVSLLIELSGRLAGQCIETALSHEDIERRAEGGGGDATVCDILALDSRNGLFCGVI